MSVANFDDDDEKWLAFAKTMSKNRLNDELCESALCGSLWRVEKLLFLGADPRAEQSCCLYYATLGKSPAIIERLVEAGADVTAQPFLCMALTHGHTESAKTLYNCGASPEVFHRDLDAFDWARETGNTVMTSVLGKPPSRKTYTAAERMDNALFRVKRRDGGKYKL